MKEQIKRRIAQFNNGEVPQGYKATTVGIVPEEWTEHTLGDIFSFKNGLNKEKEAFGVGTPIVNYTDVWKKRGLRAKDIKGRVTLSSSEIENYEAKCGDVFFTRTSETIDEIGYSSVLLEDIENAVFSGFILRGRPYNNLICKEYHQYCYSQPNMRHEIIKRSSMTTRALTSGPMLGQVSINIPSISEQSKIAEILMKWDEAIELQEQKLNKLAERHEGYLQKYLQYANLRYVRLGDICDIKKGDQLNNSELNTNGQYPMINGGVAESGFTDSYNREENTITISEGGNSCGFVNFIKQKFWSGGHCYTLHNVQMDAHSLFYILKANEQSIMRLRCGSGLPNIQKPSLENFRVGIIEDAKFLQKLIFVLKNSEQEILLNEEFLLKTKKQRSALHQCLLNGIVRV